MENTVSHEKYNLKKMYVLNLIANLNANYAAVNESELYDNIQKINEHLGKPAIAKMVGGKWNVVWGPALVNTQYPNPDKSSDTKRWVTDNAIYVAKKEDTEEYFIGISGTNGISLNGWFDQDFDVKDSVEWPLKELNPGNPEVKGVPHISKASSVGFKALWELKSEAADENLKMTLIDFLLSRTKAKTCAISVGGHSLGGCLTPLVATAIADKMYVLDNVTKNTKHYTGVKINAYPTAGPTPGNQDFANHLQLRMNEYHAVYNLNDLVPLSWDFKGLKQLTDTYKKWEFGSIRIKPDGKITSRFLYWASNFSKHQNYVRIPSNSSPNFKVTTWKNDLIPEVIIKGKKIKGDILDLVILAAANKIIKSSADSQLRRIYNKFWYRNSVVKFVRFLMQVLLQHVTAYNNPHASNGNTPWKFTEEEAKVLKPLFQHSEPSKETKEWLTQTGFELLRRLAELAADWLKGNQGNLLATLEEAEFTQDEEMEGNEAAIIQEVEEAMEQLLKDSPELVDTLPFIGNPYF